MSNVATRSTSISLLTVYKVDEVKKLNSDQLNEYLRRRLKDIKNIVKYADIITVSQEVNGSNFLDLTLDNLLYIRIPLGPAKDIKKFIKKIKEDTAIVDPLASTYHLIWLKNNEKMMLLLSSRAFRALKLSLQELDNYLLWNATLQADNEIQEYSVYVKAVQEKYYSIQAHQLLYDNERHAPAILATTNRPGGWLLVYMERLQNHVTLDKIIHTLDECGFDVKLIDFEWSGPVGTACYSHFMNHITIHWPEGAEDGKKVKVEHDNAMLEQTFQKTNLSQDSMLVDTGSC
ncbi:hypothetical protein C1646_756634 [Rhizophagus diaphanus]|nr:hypothetical protein C1646_756634 [Rhizophagus diaphanus] [Rhizophagus sp. MUCL 43196]